MNQNDSSMVALVVSNGSFVLAGIAGDDAFCAVFPSVFVWPRCSAWFRRTVLSDTVLDSSGRFASGKCFVFSAMLGSTADTIFAAVYGALRPSYLADTCSVLDVADECTKMRIFLGVRFRSCFRIQRLLARQWIQVWRQFTSISVRAWHADIISTAPRATYSMSCWSTRYGIFWEIPSGNVPYSSHLVRQWLHVHLSSPSRISLWSSGP